MIRRPMLAHWLIEDTRVGVASKSGGRRGRIHRIFKGEEHPYLVRTDDKHEIRCGLERLVPENEVPFTPPRIKLKKVKPMERKKALEERIKGFATLNKVAPVPPEEMRDLIVELDKFLKSGGFLGD